jgi:hypothetical protein
MGEHIRLRGTLLTVCMYACMHVHVLCMHACMCSACMHVLCMHPAHALVGYSAVLVPYMGVRETRTGYVPLGLVDVGSRSLGIFLVVFFVVVSRREVWGGVGARGGWCSIRSNIRTGLRLELHQVEVCPEMQTQLL